MARLEEGLLDGLCIDYAYICNVVIFHRIMFGWRIIKGLVDKELKFDSYFLKKGSCGLSFAVSIESI